MKRRLAALPICALIAFGQPNRPASPPPAVTSQLVVDAIALDASGHPVRDLTAQDFEVTQGSGARKITSFTWFDTRLHTAASRLGQEEQLPALELTPDEIRRNLVVVVDDLGLTPAGIDAVRDAMRAFVGKSMAPGDHVAILRSSGGSGTLEQLTGDARILGEAIDAIRYLGGGTSAASTGGALWLTLSYALDGLRDFPGRKVVVVFSEKPETAVAGRIAGQASQAAQEAAAAVYAIDPLERAPGGQTAVPSAMQALARDTGGWLGGDFAQVLESEQGYYAIGFEPEDSAISLSGPSPSRAPAVLKVRRPGVVVRNRAGYISRRPRIEFPAPAEQATQLSAAAKSPFADAAIGARLTALFADYPNEGPVVEAVLSFNSRGLSVIHDLEDRYHSRAVLWAAAYSDDGLTTVPLVREYTLTLTPAEYRFGLEHGLRIAFQLNPPRPGAWQVRAVVADGASDRMGSATGFVAIPEIRKGAMALSGLLMYGASKSAELDPKEGPVERTFKPGDVCVYRYSVFNALAGADKRSSLETQTRILAGGRVAITGKPMQLEFGEVPPGAVRKVSGQLTLDPRMAPGDYVLQVTVRDLLAPPGQARTATQFTGFQVRE